MKKFYFLMTIVLMAMMSLSLTSCGDDDDDFKTTTGKETIAVHKIKITVSGRPDLFKWKANFTGMTLVGNASVPSNVYDEDGNVIDVVENFSQVTVQTDKNGSMMAAAMVVTDFDEGNTGEMTINFEGWIGGKRTNSKTVTIKAGEQKAHALSFTTIPLDD